MKNDPKNVMLLLWLCFLVEACSSKPYVVQPTSERTPEEKAKIYVVSHGWHTGVVIPANGIKQKLSQLGDRFSTTPYIEFGWGDQGFYQAQDITTGLILRAIFWPTSSVIHVVAVPRDVYHYFSHSQVVDLDINGREYASLLQFISNSFHKSANGEIVELKEGIYGDSQFYQGVGDYYLMNTCNNWTAKALKSAGMDIIPIFKLTASSIMDYVEQHQQTTP